MDRRLGFDDPSSIHCSSGNAEDPLSRILSPEKKDLGVVPVQKLERFYDECSEDDGDSSTWLLSQNVEPEETEPHSMFEADMKPVVSIFPDQVKQEAEEVNDEEDDFNDSDQDMDSEQEDDSEDDSSHESESSSKSSESDNDSSSASPRPCPQPNCKLTFTTKLLLKAHLTLHGEWPCEKCPLVKDFAPHLALHELQHAQKTTPSKKQKFFPCPRCPLSEKNWDSKVDYIQHFLKTHLSFGKQTEKYLCEICGAKMTISSKKLHHHYYHNTEGLGPSQIHRCAQCPAYFVKKSQLLRHQYRVHYKAKCPTCFKTGNRRYFWHHIKICERKKLGVKVQTEWKCAEKNCGQVFAAKRTLTRHQMKVHGALGKHPCDSCDKSYSSRQMLRHHQKAVHLGLRPFPCDTCGNTFTTEQGLQKHQLIHSGERPFQCRICHKTFRESGTLKTHLEAHQNKTTVKTDFKRDVEGCLQIFSDEKAFEGHQKTAPIPTETYPCDSCDRSFVSRRHLDRHYKGVHLEGRPFPCDTCGQAFSLSHNLRRHQLIHSGERPFKCNTCQKTFNQSQYLKQHWKKTHWKKKENSSKVEDGQKEDNS